MTPDDCEAAHDLTVACFDDLADRQGRPRWPHPPRELALVRLHHILATDPEGCWAADDGDGLTGVAMATLREEVWGLSLLLVAPRAQSSGLGRGLLERSLVYGRPHRAAYITSSDDARAMRAYARAGFELRPTVHARGVPQPPPRPAAVRDGDEADAEATAAIDRRTRGGARPQDVLALLRAGLRLLVHPGRGYVVVGGGGVRTLSAVDETAARELLQAALAVSPPGEPVGIEFVTAGQDWAVEVALEAGLELEPYGPFFVRGDPGDLAHYLPSGAYL